MEKEKYDFQKIIDRTGKDAMAIDGPGKIPGFAPEGPKDGFSLIPMWIADMNFETAPCIVEAMRSRLDHMLFGYYMPTEEYYNSIIDWHNIRHGINGLTKADVGYENGVLGGLVSALSVLASKGDNILLHSPTYIGFTKTIENAGYNIVLSELEKDSDSVWRINYSDMEKKIVENKIHVLVFCSPHNPCGRVWEREEIIRVMEICEKYHVYVISDEIWSDMILKGKHIPTQSVSEDAKMRTVALYSPTKTYNLAGLVGSYHIIYNSYLRDRIKKEASICHYNSMNIMTMHATIGAYSKEGAEWLSQLLEVICHNVEYAVEYIEENFKGVEVIKPDATYMLFIDCSKWCEDHGVTIDDIEKAAWDCGVAVQDGRIFHGECHLRMNLALPFELVKEAMRRLSEYVFV